MQKVCLFDSLCISLLVHTKYLLSFTFEHRTEKVMTGHNSKSNSQTKQRLVYNIGFCSKGTLLAETTVKSWCCRSVSLHEICSHLGIQLYLLMRKRSGKEIEEIVQPEFYCALLPANIHKITQHLYYAIVIRMKNMEKTSWATDLLKVVQDSVQFLLLCEGIILKRCFFYIVYSLTQNRVTKGHRWFQQTSHDA